ncbi:MAG: peroxide stress protein YaaA [Bacteroidota bacterium]|jgi:cytoplasmic iron level regulating protein YaaA (DUF328/UPF0246 family)
MKILLSPAKLQRTFPGNTQGSLLFKKETKLLIQELKHWTASDFAVRMKLSQDKATKTFVQFQQWGQKGNQTNTAPALFAYIGEAFKALDAEQLSAHELDYLHVNLLILSGLHGLLRPFDLIEPYRLEMAQRGAAPNGQSLYAFWRAPIEKYLLKQLNKNEMILNLASSEYSDVVQDERLRARFVTPHFVELKNGQLKSVSVFSKQARGSMASWCAAKSIESIAAVKSYNEMGYVFSAAHSDDCNWYFIR